MHKFLIDECLSVTLATQAHAAGHLADHVVYMGWAGLQDWQLMPLIEQNDYLFVTNNRIVFLRLHSKTQLHSGLVVIAPSVARVGQALLFSFALAHLATISDLVNHVLEVEGPVTKPNISVRPLAAPTS